ncbi:MAG: tyrosine-type recombinase/integrase, partial [Gloeobacteraceae cyanobacterium ES-bin-144]|nr:tyrosine-type recombinase/integrase [Verrucomicrobiales bacterium]
MVGWFPGWARQRSVAGTVEDGRRFWKEVVRAVIGAVDGMCRTMAMLMYGSGLRLRKLVTLRVKDLDFGRHLLTVRCGEGDKDRANERRKRNAFGASIYPPIGPRQGCRGSFELRAPWPTSRRRRSWPRAKGEERLTASVFAHVEAEEASRPAGRGGEGKRGGRIAG